MQRYFLATGLIFALSACQSGSPSVSLEEAKQITATFEGGSFTPPPKTIADITAILDQQKRKGQEALAQMRAVADQKPPATKDLFELAQFHYRRGETASFLGRGKQSVADYRKAADLAGQSGDSGELRDRATYYYGLAELIHGNFSRGIQAIRESIKLAYQRPKYTGSVLVRYAILAGVRAKGGEIEPAEKDLDQARSLVAKSVNWSRAMDRATARTLFDNGRAMVLAARGEFREAEDLMRETIERWEPYKDEVYAKAYIDPKSPGRQYN